MPFRTLDVEQRLLLAQAAFDGLDRLLALAPQGDAIPYREISAHLHLIKMIAPRDRIIISPKFLARR